MIKHQQSLKRVGRNWLMFFLLFLIASSVNAQISGTVFRDFNANGVKNNTATYNEPGLAGITIKAYNSSNTLVGTTTSAANGSYSFTGLALPLRIEFTGFSTADYTGAVGSSNSSSVQFYSSSSSTADFGVNYPQHYTSTANPYYIVSQFEANRPPSSEALATAMLKQQYDTRGNFSYAPSIAKTSEIGGTWGVAYDRKNSLIYAASFVKRFSAMKDNDADGKEDLAAIYSMTATGSPTLWKDLSTLGIDFGLSSLPTVAARALPTTITGPTHDAAMYPLVGKIGIGDIEMSDDFTQLFVVNLFDKKVYTIDVATKTLVGTGVAVPSPCNAGTGNVRPFGLKYHRGKLYVGAICDAATSQSVNDLSASVYRLDGSSFTSVLNFPLSYVKGYAFKDNDGTLTEYGKSWNAWKDVQPTAAYHTNVTSPSSEVLIYPQPMLVNMEFDVDESLILTFNDRLGHQVGNINYGTNNADNTTFYTGVVGGDILRASLVSGVYTLESNGSAGGVTTAGANNNEGPSGGEFYFGDRSNLESNGRYHNEDVVGGSSLMAGRSEVAVIVADPIGYFTGGTYFFDNTTGDVVASTDRYQLYAEAWDNTKYGKANGLGDMEIITDAAPIEIGNRVWLDTNGDGIQDAGEAAISGVTVQLLNSVGTVIATATTDANGNYYFSSAAGTSTAALIYGVAILPNTNYTVRIPNVQGGSKQAVLGGNFLTTSNADNTDGDIRDSDGILNANNADVAITTGGYGENNHTYDFGFTSTLLCTKPNAGANQTSCPTGTITLTGTTPTTGTWAAQSGNPSGASVGSTTSGVATVTFTAATAGTFNFIYTTGSCTDTMNVVVSGSVPSTPTCSPITVCVGADATTAVNAAVSPAGGSITWIGGSANATTATSYTYTVSNSCGTASCTNTITRTSTPSTPTCSPVTVCVGADATTAVNAAVSPAGGSITWIGGSANATTATSYFNFIYTTGSCTDTMNVVVSGSVPSTPTCSPITVCVGADATTAVNAAVSPAGGSITWIGGSANATTATSYTYTVTSSCGTASCTNTITRTSTPATPTCSPVTICIGTDATIMVTAAVSPAGGTITWNTGSATTATSYTYTITGSCGSANCTNTITRVQGSIGNYVWSDLNNNGLNDEPTTAGINGVTVELWNATTNTLLASTTTANNGGNPGYYNFNICADGDYKVKFPTTVGGNGLTTQTSTASTDNNSDANTSTGFSPTFTMTLTGTGTQVNNPTIDAGYQSCVKPNAGADMSVCGIASCINLTGTNTTGGTWTALGTNPVGATLGATTTGVAQVCFTQPAPNTSMYYTYSFIYTVGSCTDTVDVTVYSKPSAGNDTTICNTTSGYTQQFVYGAWHYGGWAALATNPSGMTFVQTNVGTWDAQFSNTASGVYGFVVSYFSCTDTMYITVNPKPTTGADQMLCVQNSGSSVTLTASVAGGTWTAMAGNAGTATIVTPNNATTVVNTFSANGDYNFIYTTASGCKDTVKVTAYTSGTIGNYVWNDLNGNGQQDEAASNGINGVTVELYMETAPGSGVYTLSQTTTTANNGSGDAGYYNFNVCQSANYKIKFPTTNGAATLTQQNSNAGLDGNSDPNTSTGFTQPFAINVLGSGVLKNNPTIDAGYRCALPSPTCNPVSVCGAVDATTYVASAVSPVGGIINWNTGSATTATSYTYTVTNACGSVTCTNTITRLSAPSTPTCAPITVCAGVDAYNPVMAAVAPAGGTIVWNTGNSSTATSYTYTVSNACGSASCTNTITRTAAPTTPTCAIITLCSGVDATTAVMAAVTPAGGTIAWNTGSATTATYYTYTVTNSCGSLNCSNQIVRTPTPSSITCNPVSVCTGVDATTSVMSSVSISGGSIVWNTGNATTATSYTYTVTNACGSASCTNTITRITTPATPTCAPVTICSNNDATSMVNAAVSPSGGTITWLPNGSNGTTATSYTYTVSNACGSASCTNTITRTTAGSIGNYVWSDTNRNGLQDEPANLGINGAYVELYMDNGTGAYTLVATTHTANDGAGNPGYYNFPICTSGNYKVKFQTNYNGGNLTTQTPTPGVDGNSDADEITGYTPVIVIDINGTGTAKNNNTIDAGYKPGSVTPPTGLESKTLGDVIAVRLYGNSKNSLPLENDFTNTNKYVTSGSIVNGANDLTLNNLIPSTVVNTDAAYISTPTDLVSFTNAVEVLAVNYAQGSSTKAVAFGTKTLGDVYAHTKPICDRLKGAELMEVKNITVNGFNLMAYKVRQRTGEMEYAINLSAGTATNRNSISLQSNWFTDSYQHDEKLYNFQLWAVSYEMVKSMATDIVTKLQANGTVNTVTNADLPKAYISKGSRQGTDLLVTVNNNTAATSGYFELHEKANENASITTRQVPFTVNANGASDVTIPVSDNYEGDIYVYVNNKLTDLVYLADGTWNLDYNKSNTSISSFDVINESNPTTNTDEHRLFRNVTVTGTSKDYITIYKTMMGGGLEQNVTDYKSIMFNANAVGANRVQVTLIKKSITNWNDQYTYTMDLDGDKEYGINLNQFKSSKYAQELYANDIVAVNFSFLTSRNTPTTMNINLSKARFTNTEIATAIEVKTVSVYPNPSSGKFSVSFTNEVATPLVLKVVEVSTGRTIKTQFINAIKGKNQVAVAIDNTSLTSGLYTVTLEGDGAKFKATKLMINRE